MATTQGIKLDDDTRARLKELGKVRDRSPHYLMKKAIADFLEREERYEREREEDERRWQNYLTTGEHIDGQVMHDLLKDLSEGKSVKWPKVDG